MARRHDEIVQALADLGAISRESRKPSPQIVSQIDRSVCVKSFCCVFSDLVRSGVVSAKRGKDGGYWLTEAGK